MAIGWDEDIIVHDDGLPRCGWCGRDPLYVAYHDHEWAVPERDGQRLFEKLVLDTFQAGLSWLTILKKREAFRAAFAGFDIERVAAFSEAEVARLMQDSGIIRNRAKIKAAVANARAVLALGGAQAFSDYLWGFVDHRPLQRRPRSRADVPAASELSRRLSRDMARRGFRFCGPVVIHAFMQAVGMINEHLTGCHRHGPVARMGAEA